MIPQKLFVNIYRPFAGQIGTAYATRELADQMAARGRLACVQINMHGALVNDQSIGIVVATIAPGEPATK